MNGKEGRKAIWRWLLVVNNVVDGPGQVFGDQSFDFLLASDWSVAWQWEGAVNGVDEGVDGGGEVDGDFSVALELADGELEVLFVKHLEAFGVVHLRPHDLSLLQHLLVIQPGSSGCKFAGGNDADSDSVAAEFRSQAQREALDGVVNSRLNTANRVVDLRQGRRQEDEAAASATDEWQHNLSQANRVDDVDVQGLLQDFLWDPFELADGAPLVARHQRPQSDSSVRQVSLDELDGFVHLLTNNKFYCVVCPKIDFRLLLTCDSDEASICTTRTRAEHSSFNSSASALSVTLLKPAKTVKPMSSSFLHKYQASGDSQPVTKIAFPVEDT